MSTLTKFRKWLHYLSLSAAALTVLAMFLLQENLGKLIGVLFLFGCIFFITLIPFGSSEDPDDFDY